MHYPTLLLCTVLVLVSAMPTPGRTQTRVSTSNSAISSATIGSTTVNIATPAGYTDPSLRAPRIMQVMTKLTPPTNRLLKMYMQSSDVDTMMTGKQFDMEKYFLVQTALQAEWLEAQPSDFAKLKAELRALSASDNVKLMDNAQPGIDQGVKDIGKMVGDPEFAIKLNDSEALGIYRETPRSISMLNSSTVDGTVAGIVSSKRMAAGTTILLIKGKILYLYTFAPHRSEADLAWIRTTAESWETAVLRANGLTE